MSSPAVIDFAQSIRHEHRQKKISRNRHLWEKNSSEITKPSQNQPTDGWKRDSFVHIQHVELRNIYSVKITETRNNKLFTTPTGSLTTGTIMMKSKYCSENIVHTHRVVLVNWR